MLVLAAVGVLAVFALAVHLSKPLKGLPAFTAAFLLLASPLFYAQSMMAQLDMPAMVFTVIALVAFLASSDTPSLRYRCTVLVLMKETSIAVPAVFGAWLLLRTAMAAGDVLPGPGDRSRALACVSLPGHRTHSSAMPSLRTTTSDSNCIPCGWVSR